MKVYGLVMPKCQPLLFSITSISGLFGIFFSSICDFMFECWLIFSIECGLESIEETLRCMEIKLKISERNYVKEFRLTIALSIAHYFYYIYLATPWKLALNHCKNDL